MDPRAQLFPQPLTSKAVTGFSTWQVPMGTVVTPIRGLVMMKLMASSEVLKHVITMCTSLTSSPHSAILNCQNVSGNTPLHWASLNDHLESVKVLIHAGADPTIVNRAGHDAVYEAEINGKEAVAQWLLTEGKGLETGFKGSRDGSCIDETAQEQKERAAVQEDLEHVSLEDTL